MLHIKMVSPEILEVEEIIHGWKKTYRKFYYTNIKTWQDLTNPRATKQTENFKVAGKLADGSIDWIKKYHLPKITQ
jgi:hypothetical protein